MTDKKEKLMTLKEVAEYLRLNEHTVYRMARKGEIPAFKIAGQWRFKKEVIDKWISEQSLERVLQNVKSFPAGKSDKKLR